MLLTLVYFVFALLLLVVVHEFGHFIVARCCGVKVLRFSFGFGKVLWSWHDKRGTEYAWSLIPLGGYVKMLDEGLDEVPEHEHHLAFNNKPVLARIAIVLAGPLFNFLFAFVALWLVLVIGIQSLAPMINDIKPGSIAARAGLVAKEEITALDGKKVTSWHDVQYALMPRLGASDPVVIKLRSLIDGRETVALLSLADLQMDVKKPNVLNSLGIVPFVPAIPPIVGEVLVDSPAASVGLQAGDMITSVDGQRITDWLTLVDFVIRRPKQRMELTVTRHGAHEKIAIRSGSVRSNGREEGFLGLRSQRVDWPANWLRTEREAPIAAIGTAFHQTVGLTGATFSLIGRLITGKLSLRTISGPIGIAEGAGESARSGLAYYLSFLALVSISLGVLNVLPIPMLDGGHVLFFILEIIRRRPLTDRCKSIGIYVGVVVLVTLMLIAVGNDLTRLV